MRHSIKINIAAKVFQRSTMICIFSVIKMFWMDSKLVEKDIDKAKNVGFRVYDQVVVTYEQSKLGLSAYYDKSYVLADGIHTRPLDFLTNHHRCFFITIKRL